MTTTARYVQFGAGLCAPESWENYDVSPTLRLQRIPALGSVFQSLRIGPKFPSNIRYGDIVRGLPIADGTCDAVYSSHTMEHLSLEDCKVAISNVFRMLRTRGVFRFVLPDMEFLAKTYLESNDPDAVHRFMRESYLGVTKRTRGMKALIAKSFGNSSHLWMWDYKAMQSALAEAGFTNIRRAQFQDSGDEMFKGVEDIDRWTNCLGLHCTKP